jgi:hypothetical protein
MYKSAIKNKKFQEQLLLADPKDKKPGFFASELDKLIFITVYYGWLVARWQEKWKENL